MVEQPDRLEPQLLGLLRDGDRAPPGVLRLASGVLRRQPWGTIAPIFIAPASSPDPPSRRLATAFSIRRWRVSSVLAPVTRATTAPRLLGDRASKRARAATSASRAAAKIRWLDDLAGRGVELKVDRDRVAGGDAGRGAMLGADAEQVFVAIDGDRVAVGIGPVEGHHDRWSLAFAECRDDLGRNTEPRRRLAGGLERRAELHGRQYRREPPVRPDEGSAAGELAARVAAAAAHLDVLA